MTCIVGLVEGGTVWIGGDSAGTDSWDHQCSVKAPKVFRRGEFLFGCTTSFRMLQLLQFAFQPPVHHPDVAVETFIVIEFMSAWRTCLSSNGWLKKQNDREEGGTFLAAYRGRLFKIQDDHSAFEVSEGYNAVGSGYMVALGALHATPAMAPHDRVGAALSAAATHVASVRGPFVIEQAPV